MSDNETNNIYSDLNNISIDKLIEEKYRMRISILKLFLDDETIKFILKNNKNFIKSASCKSGQDPVSYMELYSQIAKINIDLINKRKELQIEQEEFLKSHHDFFKWKG